MGTGLGAWEEEWGWGWLSFWVKQRMLEEGLRMKGRYWADIHGAPTMGQRPHIHHST